MKKISILYIIMLFLLATQIVFGQSKVIIYNTAVTSSNDTLQSAWITGIQDLSVVELGVESNDSSVVRFVVDYKYGGSAYASTTADTLTTNSNTGAYQTITYRKGTTDDIPASGSIRVNAYRLSGSAATYTLRVSLVARE